MRRLSVAVLLLAAFVSSCSIKTAVTSVEANESDAPASDPVTSDDPTNETETEPDESSPNDPDTLDWSTCNNVTSLGIELECATLEVPLDHEQPDGEQIDIALARVPATGDPDDRIGSLVFNPGGPGGSGIDFLASAAAIMPSELAERFDLVGFDPRGVGASTAIECDLEIDDNIVLLEEGDDVGWQALVDEAESLSCDDTTTRIGSYVGTNNAARDLDLIREALGDEQLSYVGFSYGTRLGATYAELFPEAVRALVLDGGVKPTDDSAQLDGDQAAGFDLALQNFAAACDADADCILRELGPTLEIYEGLVTEIAEVGSFPTDDPDRVLTPGELQLGVFAALYSKESWTYLAQAMYLAETQQDGTLLQVLGDSYVGRQGDDTYDNVTEANRYINCADEPLRPDVDAQRELSENAAAESVYFDEFLRADTGCVGTPDPADPLVFGPADGAAPILVIGNTGDPATPYEWSVALAESLSSAVLYTVEAEGHTAFLSVDCVEEIVVRYLVDLELPDPDSSCSDNADADFFPPAGESEVDLLVSLFDCLRENGADVPELTAADVLADPSGEQILDLFDPSDPAFAEAALECQDIIGDLGAS